jgi:hypothetical protein
VRIRCPVHGRSLKKRGGRIEWHPLKKTFPSKFHELVVAVTEAASKYENHNQKPEFSDDA